MDGVAQLLLLVVLGVQPVPSCSQEPSRDVLMVMC